MTQTLFDRRTFLQGAGIAAGTMLFGYAGMTGCAPAGEARTANVGPGMTPGTYTASAQGHNGTFDVTVTVSEHAIEDITFDSNNETHFVGTHSMEQVRNSILEHQTPLVDTVTGATFSTMALVTGVKDALAQAGASERDFTVAPAPQNAYEDETVDVVVVGSGSAGVAATLEAHDRGLKAVLVEQLGVIGGSSARAGYYVGGGTKVGASQGDGYTKEAFTELLVQSNPDQTELATIYGEHAGEAIDWLYEKGLTRMHYDTECTYGQGTHWGDYGHIGGFWAEAMQQQLDSNAIDVRMNAEVIELLKQDDAVKGVRVRAVDGSEYSLFANAVVLASGGYARNAELVDKHTPELSGYGADAGTGCTGTGMLMAEQAGAILENMSDVFSYYGENVMFNGVPRNMTYPFLATGPIVVNEVGERFVNELAYYLRETVDAFNEQPGRHGFILLTQEQADALIRPSLDYAANLEAMYTKCANADEVASAFSIDAEKLKATLARYDSFVEAGVDEDFQKPETALIQKMGDGPFFVAEVQPCVHMTYGGIRTDADLHALDAQDKPISGLYAAGECRHVMLNGIGTNTIALVDGRRAIEQIVQDAK